MGYFCVIEWSTKPLNTPAQVERRARQGPQRMLKIWRKDVRNGYRLMEQWQVRFWALGRQAAELGTRVLPVWPASERLCGAVPV